MTPTKAVLYLMAQRWTEKQIGKAVGANQSTISRISSGADPKFALGAKLIELAVKEKGRK